MTFSKFNLENPRSRSWVRGKLKVTTWVQHSIDSHPFHSMSIRHPIPKIQIFQIWPFLKIQGQSHGWDQSWKSQSGCYILSTHIPFVPCQSALPFLRYSISKIWPWKSKVKVMGEGNVESHNMGATFYRLTSSVGNSHRSASPRPTTLEGDRELFVDFSSILYLWFEIQGMRTYNFFDGVSNTAHITFVPCQLDLPFLRYSIFKIWPWKSKVKVMGEGNVESHKVGVTSYRLTSLSFHVNRASHSWVMTFSKFDLENQGSRSWVKSQFKVTMWV